MGFLDYRPTCPFCAKEGHVCRECRKTPAGWVCQRCGRVFVERRRSSLLDF